jgi:hypothetical protein
MVLEDKLLVDLDRETLDRVLWPKVLGSAFLLSGLPCVNLISLRWHRIQRPHAFLEP